MDVRDVNKKKPVDELLQAHGHAWNLLCSFINSMSIKCAIDLGIPDIIHKHGKPMKVTELIAALPINASKAHNIHRLMRILIHSGLFAEQNTSENDGEEGYVLTSTCMLLRQDEPLSVTPLFKAMLDPAFMNSFHFLSAWFVNDDPTACYTAHGKTFWDYCVHDPKLGHLFQEGMASDAQLVSSILTTECTGLFEGLNSLVDVGGGTGTMAKAIADAFPHLDCIVFDLPHVVNGLQGTENLKYVGGDMFEGVPAAQAVLLKWIMHDWNHDECMKILKQCKKAIFLKNVKGGKVIIIDMVLRQKKKNVNEDKEDHSFIETQLFFDILMMTKLTGKERSEEEWAKLFLGAGFSDYKITPLGLRSIIEVYP